MTAPSNANTSGLEVVAWAKEEYLADTRAKKRGAYWMWGNPSFESSVALVTAASAQAEREARLAAEARADRLAKALEYIATLNCGYGPAETEAENNLGQCVAELQREARAALQQEG